MKRVFCVVIAACILGSQIIISCPTCVGLLENDTPEFFSDEFYQPYADIRSTKDTKDNTDEGDEYEKDDIDSDEHDSHLSE